MPFSKWDLRYMRVAKEVSSWSSCLSRNVGCVITNGNRIIATGYNGAPAGVKNCKERGYCRRKDAERGTALDNCLATHAEQNALIQAAKQGVSVDGGVLYCTTRPCTTCAKLIINSGIKRVLYSEDYPNPLADELLIEAGIEVERLILEG